MRTYLVIDVTSKILLASGLIEDEANSAKACYSEHFPEHHFEVIPENNR